MTSAIKTTERRQNLQHRQVFEGVYERVEPFLDNANSWPGQPLELLAFSVLRENYPQVSDEQINSFFSAAKRAFAERCRKH